MSTTTARRNAVKILASVALVAGAATVAGIGTFGAYTDTTSADTSVSSASVQVLMNGSDNGVKVDAIDMRPGSKVVAPIKITRGADTSPIDDLVVDTKVTTVNALSSALRLSVDACSVPWTQTGSNLTCTGTTTNVAQDAPLGDSHGSTKAYQPTAGWVGQLNSNNPIYLRATLSLPTGASESSSGLKTGITWKLSATLATGTTTVVTPTAS